MVDRTQYLIALYEAEREDSPPISPGAIADELGRSSPAVTEMCKRLQSDGLVDYEPYEGATLTEAGRETAERRHETCETLRLFLGEVLAVEDPDAEAMALAGAVSPTVAKRLEATLIEDDVGERAASDPSGSDLPDPPSR